MPQSECREDEATVKGNFCPQKMAAENLILMESGQFCSVGEQTGRPPSCVPDVFAFHC